MSLGSTLIRSAYNLGKINHFIKVSKLSSRSFSVKKTILLNIDKTKLKFTEKHEWISLNGNIGTIGITDYAQVSSYFVQIKARIKLKFELHGNENEKLIY